MEPYNIRSVNGATPVGELVNPSPGCELGFALGGDGTILRALQLAMAHRAAVLGVNFGTVGFLADIDGAELSAALDRVARGEAQIDARTALVASLEARGH